MQSRRIDRRLPPSVVEYWQHRRLWDRWEVERSEVTTGAVHSNQRLVTVRTIRSLVSEPARILDLCCGTGRITYDLMALPQVTRIVAVDVSELALQRLIHRIEGHPLRAKVTTMRRDVLQERALSSLQGFDAIVCIDALHHLSDLARAIHVIADLLKPSGLFVGNCLAREQARRHVTAKSGLTTYLFKRSRAEIVRRLCPEGPLWDYAGRKGYVRMHLLDRTDVLAMLDGRFLLHAFEMGDYHWFAARKLPAPGPSRQ